MNSPEFRTRARDVEVILARTLNTCDWTEPYRHRRTIYQKGPEAMAGVCILPDVGGYPHTYLHHIVTHYDDLAAVTLFLNDTCPQTGPENVESYIDVDEDIVFDSVQIIDLTEPDWLDRDGYFKQLAISRSHIRATQMQCASTPFRAWFERAILPYRGDDTSFSEIQNAFIATTTGNFCVHRSVIHDKPVEFYQSLLNWVSGHRNPEWSNYVDHSWMYIFAPLHVTSPRIGLAGHPDHPLYLFSQRKTARNRPSRIPMDCYQPAL